MLQSYRSMIKKRLQHTLHCSRQPAWWFLNMSECSPQPLMRLTLEDSMVFCNMNIWSSREEIGCLPSNVLFFSSWRLREPGESFGKHKLIIIACHWKQKLLIPKFKDKWHLRCILTSSFSLAETLKKEIYIHIFKQSHFDRTGLRVSCIHGSLTNVRNCIPPMGKIRENHLVRTGDNNLLA